APALDDPALEGRAGSSLRAREHAAHGDAAHLAVDELGRLDAPRLGHGKRDLERAALVAVLDEGGEAARAGHERSEFGSRGSIAERSVRAAKVEHGTSTLDVRPISCTSMQKKLSLVALVIVLLCGGAWLAFQDGRGERKVAEPSAAPAAADTRQA